MFAAFLLAASVGFGVYQSCTVYGHIMPQALLIDAAGAMAVIFVFHWLGAW